MSAEVSLKSSAPRAPLRKIIPRIAEPKKDIKQCLKLLESGELQLGDVCGIYEEVLVKPHLGDHIQYELHKYCQKNVNQTNSELVVKLAELCYSAVSVSSFTNVDRFLGCVYYISNYLLKSGKYESVVNIVKSLEMKRDEISQASIEKSDARATLSNIHSILIASAVSLALKEDDSPDEISRSCHHNLAMESLKLLTLINSEQIEIGRKVLKTSVLYLQTLKCFTDEEVLEFYRMLNTVLRTLLPKMETQNFCFYYLYKLNQFKKLDSDPEIILMLKKAIYLLALYLNSSVEVKNSLNKLLDFFFSKNSNAVQGCEPNWIESEDFEILSVKRFDGQVYFLVLSTIFSYGVQFLWKKYEKNWGENISVELVKNLCNCLLFLHRCQSRNAKFYCSSGPVNYCFGDLIAGNLSKVQYFVRLCLKYKVPNALSLVLISQKAFRMSMECLQYMKSRGCSVEQRTYSWKFAVIHHTNTVEDICRHVPSEEGWLLLKECSQEVIRAVVRSNLELPFDFKRISILFQRWHSSCLRLKNYRDALYACVVYYVFYPEEEKEIMSMWLQAKSESSNEVIEEMTMSEILKTCDKDLNEFCPSYDSSKIVLKNVLLMEIKAYSCCPPSIFQNSNTTHLLATRIWKQLEKSHLDLWETSFALSSLISVIVTREDKALSNDLLERCQKLINDLLNWKGKMQGRSLLHAANLNFSLFLYNVKLAESSEGQMDTSHMVLEYLKKAEEEKVKFGEDVDLNLTCDVIPSSSHLTVALETNYLDKLYKIVDLWNGAFKIGFEVLPSPMEFDLWERNVKQVAHLYTLYGEYRRAFTTWLLFYRIGKMRGNSAAILLGLSHIIENCEDVDDYGIKEEAELILGKLGSEETEKYIAVEYSLAMASNYLKNKRSDKCLEHLSIAKKTLEGLRTTITTCALNAKFWRLVSQFLVLYKKYEAAFDYPENTDARVMAFKAFNYANGAGRSDLIKTAAQSECMELILAMLDVNLWAYHLHGVYRQTDFMRFFLDDLYQIVQKLLLPTRTAEMLVRLAEVDVICEKVEDCRGKITKLKNILTTLPSRCGESVECGNLNSPLLELPEKSDLDVPSPRPISPARFLDKPPQSRDLDLSPFHYYLDDVKSSKSSEHLRKCKCRLCENLLIQSLTLNTIWLEAEMCNLGNCVKRAAACYVQGHDMLKKLEFLRAEQSKILRVELAAVLKEVPGELDFQLTPLQFLSARFLIRYALFESTCLNPRTETVRKTVLRVNELMKKFSYEVKLLQWTFAELKLVCLILGKKNEKQPKKSATPVQLRATNVTKTPFVGSTTTAATAIRRNEKKIKKKENGPNQCPEVDIEPENSTNAMNTVVKGAEKTNSLRAVLQRRKLNFDAIEPEVDTQTVRKFPAAKTAVIQSRKLDFDLSGDMFEEREPNDRDRESGNVIRPEKETAAKGAIAFAEPRESSRRRKKTTETNVREDKEAKGESRKKKTTGTSIKVYTEPKEEPRRRNAVAAQSKSRKV